MLYLSLPPLSADLFLPVKLAAQYLYFTSNPRFCWSIVGFGLRLAEDIGAHRHKNWTTMLTAEEELEKRAMWYVAFRRHLFGIILNPISTRMLLMFDTQLSCALGRPRTVNQRECVPSICLRDQAYRVSLPAWISSFRRNATTTSTGRRVTPSASRWGDLQKSRILSPHSLLTASYSSRRAHL